LAKYATEWFDPAGRHTLQLAPGNSQRRTILTQRAEHVDVDWRISAAKGQFGTTC